MKRDMFVDALDFMEPVKYSALSNVINDYYTDLVQKKGYDAWSVMECIKNHVEFMFTSVDEDLRKELEAPPPPRGPDAPET